MNMWFLAVTAAKLERAATLHDRLQRVEELADDSQSARVTRTRKGKS